MKIKDVLVEFGVEVSTSIINESSIDNPPDVPYCVLVSTLKTSEAMDKILDEIESVLPAEVDTKTAKGLKPLVKQIKIRNAAIHEIRVKIQNLFKEDADVLQTEAE